MPPMERSLRFVLLGTFTLRFSTGLTGRDARALPGRPAGARWRAGRRDRRRDLRRGVLPVRAGPVADLRHPVRPVRPPPGDALRPDLRRDRRDHHRADGPAAGPRRDAAARGRLDRRQRARRSSASSRWRPPATSCCAARRRPASRAPRWPGSASGFIVAPKLFEAIGPNAFFLNAVVYGISFLDLLARGQGSGRRGRGGRVAARRLRPVRSRSSARRTSCCWRRPGSRSTPASGCGSASRCSSSRRPTRRSPTRP